MLGSGWEGGGEGGEEGERRGRGGRGGGEGEEGTRRTGEGRDKEEGRGQGLHEPWRHPMRQLLTVTADVRERPPVDDGRRMLQGLHQIGEEGVLQQRRHRSGCLQIFRGYRRPLPGMAANDVAQSPLQIRKVFCQTQDRHYFGRDRDIKTVLPRIAIAGTA